MSTLWSTRSWNWFPKRFTTTDETLCLSAMTLECASNPCMSGATCNEDINKYTCTCVPGYNGINCEEGGYLRSTKISQSYITGHECGWMYVLCTHVSQY